MGVECGIIFDMKTINLSKVLKGFSSGWVAITADYKQVIAFGKTLEAVSKSLEKQKRDDVVLISASRNYRGFVTSA